MTYMRECWLRVVYKRVRQGCQAKLLSPYRCLISKNINLNRMSSTCCSKNGLCGGLTKYCRLLPVARCYDTASEETPFSGDIRFGMRDNLALKDNEDMFCALLFNNGKHSRSWCSLVCGEFVQLRSFVSIVWDFFISFQLPQICRFPFLPPRACTCGMETIFLPWMSTKVTMRYWNRSL